LPVKYFQDISKKIDNQNENEFKNQNEKLESILKIKMEKE